METIEEQSIAIRAVAYAPSRVIPKRVQRVAIVGFGTVGRSVARILSEGVPGFTLTHIANRNVERKRVDWVSENVTWTSDFSEVLASEAEVIVELIGGIHPAKEWISAALKSGRSVVTANKQLIAAHGTELAALARRHEQTISYGAAVCGGIPVLSALEHGLAGDTIVRLRGVLNGTCNYILSRMESGHVLFEDALAEAQQLGYAEADPTDDLDGFDARAKLTILARTAFHCRVSTEQILARSIRRVQDVDFVYARRLGCTIRQLSSAAVGRDELVATVEPALVPVASSVASTHGSQNVLIATGKFGGDCVFSGFGAGGNPTAVAVVSDLRELDDQGPRAILSNAQRQLSITANITVPYYLRLVINDKPGLLARIATVLSEHNINIDAVLQEPGYPKERLPFVLTLDPCSRNAVEAAVAEIDQFDFLAEPALYMPITN